MSNPLIVRRVKFQDLDETGRATGKPTYGVIASDNEAFILVNHFTTFKELNDAIDEAGSILAVVDGDSESSPEANHEKIGTKNFHDNDWTLD